MVTVFMQLVIIYSKEVLYVGNLKIWKVQSLIKEFKQAVIQSYPKLFQYTERM
ncbi:hypothetical protein [Clostridium sp. 1xD42-85]|uniref:hypothetical protein n=1 Tax=Clostridium sp. 1xD42-85 TaxID=2320084 RepID=UPI001A9AAFC2|nr:hypothetical protein [Clostridium sp. 1xD42-85]